MENFEQTNVGVDFSRLEGTEINPPKMAMNLLLSQYRFPWDEDDRFFPTFNTKLLTPCRHIDIDIDIPSSHMDLVTYGISRLQKL